MNLEKFIDFELIHIIALKDNKIYDLEKRIEELLLDCKYLQKRGDDALLEASEMWIKLYNVKRAINGDG